MVVPTRKRSPLGTTTVRLPSGKNAWPFALRSLKVPNKMPLLCPNGLYPRLRWVGVVCAFDSNTHTTHSRRPVVFRTPHPAYNASFHATLSCSNTADIGCFQGENVQRKKCSGFHARIEKAHTKLQRDVLIYKPSPVTVELRPRCGKSVVDLDFNSDSRVHTKISAQITV